MKKQIEVRMFGLSELGISEMNEYYKHNIIKYNWEPFKTSSFGKRKKRFKQIKDFSLDSHIMTWDVKQHNPDNPREEGWFDLQVKHFVHEIYEVEVVEKFTQINLV